MDIHTHIYIYLYIYIVGIYFGSGYWSRIQRPSLTYISSSGQEGCPQQFETGGPPWDLEVSNCCALEWLIWLCYVVA